ncbi:MAG: VanZ family protein [Eubacteriales bacterium]|nr:VanZ family protein [Eubacteriales bacterium]
MTEIIKSIISDILIALYEPFWFAVILSVLFMFVYKSYPGVKAAAEQWILWFKTDKSFRRMFLLVFYTVMILFRTLLNRSMWANPLSDVFGNWGLFKQDGRLTTEPIENFILFIPFIVILFWTYKNRLLGKTIRLKRTLLISAKITVLFSFTIEMLQLLLCLGTWQLSDLFYNTLGGTVGGLIYYIMYQIKHRKNKRIKEQKSGIEGR